MAIAYTEARRDITAFLASLRQTVDRPFRQRNPQSEAERERLAHTLLMIEEARINFNTYTRYRDDPTPEEWKLARHQLLEFTTKFAALIRINSELSSRRFSLGALMLRERENPTAFIRQFLVDERRFSVSEALIAFQLHLDSLTVDRVQAQGTLSLQDIKRIVPRQQVAPVQFNIIDNRIAVASQTPKSRPEDQSNIAAAFEHIKGSGEALLKTLSQSNCHPKLYESVAELHEQVSSGANVVKVGLTNMACGVMGAQFKEELPDAVTGMLHAYNASISLYVAQFPDWEQFTQNAASIDLDDQDIIEIGNAASELIEALTNREDIADKEVPKTIAFVRQFLANPGSSSKRAAYAMLKTIENLISSIVRHGLKFFEQTAERTVDAASKTASKTIVALLGIALVSASGVGGAAANAGAPWVKQAAEFVQKQVEQRIKEI
ncbi:hypothetical protein [uncultured Sphingomonas sp.]|uniref:hypothetical protein n=1 Tax=uncultured Sphingomonas sp. TaxID=158754 RepID=UPI0025D8C70B|nr:hypothetical protein [uncultured Sphingomonas sp.]